MVKTKHLTPRRPVQWHELKDPFCEYHKRYGVEYYAVEPSTYYTLSLWRFRAMHFILSGMAAAELRNVLLVDLRDTIFQVGFEASAASLVALSCMLAGIHLPSCK